MKQATRLYLNAQNGDRRAASELVRLFYQKVYNYLRRLSKSSLCAQDLTQETFRRLWSSLGSYRGGCAFSTWIYRIAYSVYVDWLRDKGGATGKSDLWWGSQADGKPGPREHAEDRQLAERLYRLVDELAEEDKQLIYLHFYQGLSLRETASVLDEAASTVRYRFRNAMAKLRSEMGGR